MQTITPQKAIIPKVLKEKDWDHIFENDIYNREFKNQPSKETIKQFDNCKASIKTTEKNYLVSIYYPFGWCRHVKLLRNEKLDENIKISIQQLKKWTVREKFKKLQK